MGVVALGLLARILLSEIVALNMTIAGPLLPTVGRVVNLRMVHVLSL